MRRIFSTVRLPQLPAFTVESLAITATGRPSMVPMPVTTPSAGSSGSSAFARAPSSMNESASRRSASRSRANSFRCSAFFRWYFSAPPFRTRSSSMAMRWSGVCVSSAIFSLSRAPARSLSDELRLPLLREGAQRLHAVLRPEAILVHARLEREGLVHREMEPAVDGALGLAQRDRGVAADQLRQRERLVPELGRRRHPRHETPGERLGCADPPGGQHEI